MFKLRGEGRIRAVFGELAIVFVGVLVALAVDSWWQSREDRADLQANLEALAVDMDSAAEQLRLMIAHNETNLALYSEVREGLLADDPERYGRLVELSGHGHGIAIPPVSLGTLRFLVSGGGIRLVDDSTLRSSLLRDLSLIELAQHWMSELAAEWREASHLVDRAADTSAMQQAPWPESAVENIDVISGLTMMHDRLENIVNLQGRVLERVERIASVAREAGV